MPSRCQHSVHRKEPIEIKLGGKKKEVISLEQGWNHVHQSWEFCDEGMFVDPRRKRVSIKRPHSMPRDSKYKIKTKSEDMI